MSSGNRTVGSVLVGGVFVVTAIAMILYGGNLVLRGFDLYQMLSRPTTQVYFALRGVQPDEARLFAYAYMLGGGLLVYMGLGVASYAGDVGSSR